MIAVTRREGFDGRHVSTVCVLIYLSIRNEPTDPGEVMRSFSEEAIQAAGCARLVLLSEPNTLDNVRQIAAQGEAGSACSITGCASVVPFFQASKRVGGRFGFWSSVEQVVGFTLSDPKKLVSAGPTFAASESREVNEYQILECANRPILSNCGTIH